MTIQKLEAYRGNTVDWDKLTPKEQVELAMKLDDIALEDGELHTDESEFLEAEARKLPFRSPAEVYLHEAYQMPQVNVLPEPDLAAVRKFVLGNMDTLHNESTEKQLNAITDLSSLILNDKEGSFRERRAAKVMEESGLDAAAEKILRDGVNRDDGNFLASQLFATVTKSLALPPDVLNGVSVIRDTFYQHVPADTKDRVFNFIKDNPSRFGLQVSPNGLFSSGRLSFFLVTPDEAENIKNYVDMWNDSDKKGKLEVLDQAPIKNPDDFPHYDVTGRAQDVNYELFAINKTLYLKVTSFWGGPEHASWFKVGSLRVRRAQPNISS